MTFTIWRSDRSIWALPIRPDDATDCGRSPIFVCRPDDAPIIRFSAYEFHARPFETWRGASFRRLRMASVPIRIYSICPAELIGSGRKARMAVWGSPKGIDAESVFYLASRGERGLRIIDGTADQDTMVRSYVQSMAGLHQG